MARRTPWIHSTAARRSSAHRFSLHCEQLEPRDVPSVPVQQDEQFLPSEFVKAEQYDLAAKMSPIDQVTHYIEEHGAIGAPLRAAARDRFAIADGGGSTTVVRVYDSVSRAQLGTIVPFGPGFTGGARVATGDVNGDGIEDIVVGSGSGSPATVKVFDGGNLAEARAFAAYNSGFSGAVFVAVGDVNGDGRADIVTGAGEGGGPHVQVFDGLDLFPGRDLASVVPKPRMGFFAFEAAFRGGVAVAIADLDGDGREEIVVGAGPGGGPRVSAYDAVDLSVRANFFAYDPGFRGGVLVTAGDVDGNGRDEIVTGPGVGGGPHVRVFDGDTVIRDLYPFDVGQRGGVTVAALDATADGRSELVIGTGPGTPPRVRVIDPLTRAELSDIPVMSAMHGVFVG